METVTPAPKKQSRAFGILITLALMLLSFVAGAYVGMNPEWIPNMPWAYQPKSDDSSTSTHMPTSQPAGVSGESPSTQPSSSNP